MVDEPATQDRLGIETQLKGPGHPLRIEVSGKGDEVSALPVVQVAGQCSIRSSVSAG